MCIQLPCINGYGENVFRMTKASSNSVSISIQKRQLSEIINRLPGFGVIIDDKAFIEAFGSNTAWEVPISDPNTVVSCPRNIVENSLSIESINFKVGDSSDVSHFDTCISSNYTELIFDVRSGNATYPIDNVKGNLNMLVVRNIYVASNVKENPCRYFDDDSPDIFRRKLVPGAYATYDITEGAGDSAKQVPKTYRKSTYESMKVPAIPEFKLYAQSTPVIYRQHKDNVSQILTAITPGAITSKYLMYKFGNKSDGRMASNSFMGNAVTMNISLSQPDQLSDYVSSLTAANKRLPRFNLVLESKDIIKNVDGKLIRYTNTR